MAFCGTRQNIADTSLVLWYVAPIASWLSGLPGTEGWEPCCPIPKPSPQALVPDEPSASCWNFFFKYLKEAFGSLLEQECRCLWWSRKLPSMKNFATISPTLGNGPEYIKRQNQTQSLEPGELFSGTLYSCLRILESLLCKEEDLWGQQRLLWRIQNMAKSRTSPFVYPVKFFLRVHSVTSAGRGNLCTCRSQIVSPQVTQPPEPQI